MITNVGKDEIRSRIVGSGLFSTMAFGIGSTPPAASDRSLEYEFARVPVSLVTYDYVNEKIIVKATLPETLSGRITEVGVYSPGSESYGYNFNSRNLIVFDSADEQWTNSTWVTSGVRIGADALRQAPAANATILSETVSLYADMSGDSGDDKILVAVNVGNSNTANIKLRLGTDSSNYYEFTATNPATGFRILSFTKGNAVSVGNPNWSTIYYIAVSTTSKAAGASQTTFEGIRVEDAEQTERGFSLIARAVVPEIIKPLGKSQDIEYAFEVNA